MEVLAYINQLQRRSLILGAGGLILCGIGAIFTPAQFFHSYLFAYVFWFGIALGSLAISFLHHLTGGRWGAVVRRLLESSTRTLPLLALLFLPILAGLPQLYEWTDAQRVSADHLLKEKAVYLNIPFFVFRTALYFGIWIFLAYLLNRWSRQQDEAESAALLTRFQVIGGAGLLLYGLTMTFASVDWMMSLEPHWFSTIYGLLVITGQVLSAFAFTICVAALLANYKPLSDVISSAQFHDLGNLTLAFVMIWAYLAFSQFLIIWAGNLPEEIPWYIHRLDSGWQWVALLLLLFHFTLPFLLLLSRGTKKNPRLLAGVALGVLFLRVVDLFWLIAPDFHKHGLAVHYMDILLPIGIGGIWIAFYLHQLKSRPLVAVHDPNLKEILEHGRSSS